MFQINEDNSIYVTRGDVLFFCVTAEDNGEPFKFQAGDVLRFKVYGKKDAESVVLQKDFSITETTEKMWINLTEEDTKIGETISKPKDYWYEVELNPDTNPQTIIGYDDDGAKVFKLFPEGEDIPETPVKPEDIPVVDTELDMASNRPVENGAIARAFENLREGYEAVFNSVEKLYVTPQMFGAIGDGEADDTEAFKSLSDFIISEATTKGTIHEIVIPSGTYKLSDTWTIPRCHIKGYGAKLIFDCKNKSLIDFHNYDGEKWCYEVIVEGLGITTTETGNYTNIGIDMDNTSQLIFRDVYVFNCHIGINYVNASITTIERPTIQKCDIAVYVGNYSSTLNISNCDFYQNNVGFKCDGFSTSIFVTDSYFEEQDVDVLVEDVSTETILSNIVFERVHIVKANLLNKENDTYVLKTVKSTGNTTSAEFKFINCQATFNPDGRKHFFAYNDACEKVMVESCNNSVYYTASQEGAVIFKTINNSYYQYVVMNNGFKHDNDVELYSGSIRKCGVDNTGGYYNLVHGQLTFDKSPDAENTKSLFYNHYTDRLVFKNANNESLPIVCGSAGSISKSYATDVETLKNSFNELLDILKEMNVVNLK